MFVFLSLSTNTDIIFWTKMPENMKIINTNPKILIWFYEGVFKTSVTNEYVMSFD